MNETQLIDTLTNIVQYVIMAYFISAFIRPVHKYRFMALFPVFFFALYTVTMADSTLQRAATWIALFAVVLFFTTLPRVKTFLYLVIAIIIMNLTEVPFSLILLHFYPDVRATSEIPPMILLAFKICSVPVLVLSWCFSNWLCRKIFRMEEDQAIRRYIPFFVVETAAIVFSQITFITGSSFIFVYLCEIGILSAMLIIDLLLIRTINQLNSVHATELELQQAENMINHQAEIYAMFQSQLFSLHRIRHDTSNQLSSIAYLLEAGENEKALQQLSAFRQTVSQISGVRYTGNTIVDAVLNVKISGIEDDNIRFQHDGVIPENIGIDPAAICSVISNLIDNAVNGCRKAELGDQPAVISFTAGIRQNFLIFRCANPCKPDTPLPDCQLPDASELHGWGSHILRQIAAMHDGTVSFNIVSDQFITEIQLNLSASQEDHINEHN